MLAVRPDRVLPEHRRVVQRLADEWGIPIVSSHELSTFAHELGNEVCRLIRPNPRPA